MEYNETEPGQGAPVVTHLNIEPNASDEVKEAVRDLVNAAYNYDPGYPVCGACGRTTGPFVTNFLCEACNYSDDDDDGLPF